jgi:hypothetical protein
MLKRLLLAVALTAGLALPAHAAMSSATDGTIRNPARVIPFAKKVETLLAERGAVVAIVARVGRDPKEMPNGITYTHVGIWVYSEITKPDGRKVPGYVAHNLYQNEKDNNRSELVDDLPVQFFGNVAELKSGIIIPKPELQVALLKQLASPGYKDLFVPNYSVVANPYSWRYQNCTNFVMANILAAIYGTSDKTEVTAHLRASYEPKAVPISGVVRALGPIFVDGFHTDDQDGAVKTSTFESIAAFLQRYNLAEDVIEVREDAAAR